MVRALLLGCVFIVSALNGWGQSPEQQAARQARSVHVSPAGWGRSAEIFYCETRAEKVYPGTYFCTTAFSGGSRNFPTAAMSRFSPFGSREIPLIPPPIRTGSRKKSGQGLSMEVRG